MGFITDVTKLLFYILLIFIYLFIYLLRSSQGGAEREGERNPKQALRWQWGANSRTVRLSPEPKPRVRCLTDWVTQTPSYSYFTVFPIEHILHFIYHLSTYLFILHFKKHRMHKESAPTNEFPWIKHTRVTNIQMRRLTTNCIPETSLSCLLDSSYPSLPRTTSPILTFIRRE